MNYAARRKIPSFFFSWIDERERPRDNLDSRRSPSGMNKQIVQVSGKTADIIRCPVLACEITVSDFALFAQQKLKKFV